MGPLVDSNRLLGQSKHCIVDLVAQLNDVAARDKGQQCEAK